MKKGLSEYHWRLISKLLSRNYSTRDAFEFMAKAFPDCLEIQNIRNGLDQGIVLNSLLGKGEFDRKLKFYLQFISLDKSIRITENEMKVQRQLRQKIVSKTSYQFILIISSMAILVLFTNVVMPTMLNSIDISNRKTTVIITAFSIINVIKNTVIILLLLSILIITWIRIRKREEYVWIFLHKYHMDGFARMLITYSFASKLVILLKNGVSIVDSVRILRFQNSNALIRLLAYHFDETLLNGERFEKSLDMDYFDDRFHSLCLFGLKSDDFGEALEDYIVMTESKVENFVGKTVFVFQGVCYLFVAVIIVMAYRVLMLPLEMLQQF
ncbi:MAG: type II secretion system F family protein [Erysipelotrichaceae bacterium]|nr:type II secretion system F family protein [Erysipelotrichaceae bacterium]